MVHSTTITTSKATFRRIVPFIITPAVLVIGFILVEDDLKTFLIYAGLIVVFSIFRFDSRIPVMFAILLLIIAGVFISQQQSDSASRLAVQSYLLLFVGISCVVIEFFKSMRGREALRG